ncbi:unnamed protein product [Ectocarpus fasciculatus]
MEEPRPQKVLNINVGVLGHVDSGKTSLVKALSTSLSTAALDKNPQSQERGITLDLGFSARMIDMPEHLKADPLYCSGGIPYDKLQFTLVDCPGHASLIRTIIGGAQIIDMMILVIDINRGVQTQTAECVVIGEITTSKLVIVLNKVDMIPADQREDKIDKVKKRLRKIFSTTKFHHAPMICVSAAVGGERSKSAAPRPAVVSEGIAEVVSTLTSMVKTIPVRNTTAPFYFAVDHCFAIKGHGTVLTGTVLSGSVSVHNTIELPDLKEQKKVKSMQMFKKPVKFAQQGDRVGICVTGLDPSAIERGVLAAPGSVPLLSSAICLVKKVRYFKQACRSKQKFHISVGHTTVVATVMFFGAAELQLYLQKQATIAKKGEAAVVGSLVQDGASSFPKITFPWELDFEYQDDISAAADEHGEEAVQFALLVFQHPILVPVNALAIGSRLETDARESVVTSTHCRIAFYGPVLCPSAPAEAFAPSAAVTKDKPRIYNWKSKEAEILRLVDVHKESGVCMEAIGWKLFSKEAGISKYLGLRLETEEGDVVGFVHSSFGSTGKFKVKFPLGITGLRPKDRLFLRYKRYIYDKSKAMFQQLKPAITECVPGALAYGKASEALPTGSTDAGSGRAGTVDSVKPGSSGHTCICIVSGAFRMEENIRDHVGAVATAPSGLTGSLVGPYAKMGKCKIEFSSTTGVSVGDTITISCSC